MCFLDANFTIHEISSIFDVKMLFDVIISSINDRFAYAIHSYLFISRYLDLPHDSDLSDKNKPGSLPDLTNFHVNANAPVTSLLGDGEDQGSPYSSVSDTHPLLEVKIPRCFLGFNGQFDFV